MNANNLFSQVVDLTAIRDVELLEYSLLRTLDQFLKPLDLRILRMDTQHILRGQIVFSHDQCRVSHTHELILDQTVSDMLEHMQVNDACEYTINKEDGYLTIYHLHKTAASNLYIQILNHDRLSRQNRHFLMGMLEIFKNYVGLLAESITDPLTGLLNRKSFDGAMDKIYNMLPKHEENDQYALDDEFRQHQPDSYWLVMLDIDHFKQINDTFGHVYGDDVLILLSRIIRGSFRNEDLIFRFGGEEFVLLIQCESADSASLDLKRLLERVENHHFPRVEKVTLSAGAVAIDRYTFSGTLLEYADQALYASKENGRNQVTFFEDLIAAGDINKQTLCTGDVELF